MALIPSFEHLLVQVRQGLGIKALPSEDRFVAQEMSLKVHTGQAAKLLSSIFESLDIDKDKKACHAALDNLMEWANFYKQIELNTWTGSASEKQVLWHLLAYAYVPGAARHLAFWSLAGIEAQKPFDSGMPGGEFWFLPHWDVETNTLTLPVPQVIDWLLDLLGTKSFEKSKDALGKKSLRDGDGSDAVVRTLQNWHRGTGPQSAQKIEQLFPDDATLNFSGAFLPDESLTFKDQVQAAQDFVERKKLTAKTLHNQIPMTVERLDAVFEGTAPEAEKHEFVRLLALRYAQPCMRTVRQRLRVARLAQEGYKSLLKTLCGEAVEATCTDPDQNKLLQLIDLFKSIYNLTIAAHQNAGSVEDQDAWFEARLAPWDKADLLLSITPSQRDTAYLQLAERLTRKFMALTPDSPLEDLVPKGNENNVKAVITRRILCLKQEQEGNQRLSALIEKVRQSSPWRALEAESSYWVVSQFAHTKNLSPNARDFAIKRMRDLAATPGQTVGATVLELGFLLNGEPKQRPKDIQQRVQLLLDEALTNPQGFDEWKAPLLRLRAKHWLMQNEFGNACTDFKAALKACSERGFGGARGEIARDGLATEIAVNGFIAQNQEIYYRNMLSYGMSPDGMASIQDTAVWCDAFFWNDLYHPYPGIERKERLTQQVFKAVLTETFGLIETADWDGLRLWMKRHAQLRKGNFKDARCDSVLSLWLKMLHTLESTRPALKAMLPMGMAAEAEFEKVQSHIRNRRKAIGLLLETWPEQANSSDFKGQTPLMLVADEGNAELTRLLTPLSDLGSQDYRGRTALHSAASGRSPDCVAIVIDHYFKHGEPGFDKVTEGEENTALHTAVRFGQPDCVELILDAFPSLASELNASKETPLGMARDILKNLNQWQSFMRSENRRTGEKGDFERIITLLEVQVAVTE